MVAVRPSDLPDFVDPPVVEAALSVQFDPIAGLNTARLALVWQEFKENFPNSEERPPLEQVIEHFPEVPRVRLGLQLETLDNIPVPRLWFVNKQGNEMIQVQVDRFIKNWRKEGEGEQYPHYDETIKPQFERDFRTFVGFLRNNGLDAPSINQCEVTYVNHIVSGAGWHHFGEIDEIFRFLKPSSEEIPGRLDDLRLHGRFVIPNEEGEPIGRLHADIQPAIRTSDDKPMYVFHLTARGQVGTGYEFFDIGRRWIVKSFSSLTTSKMHAIWRRKDIALRS